MTSLPRCTAPTAIRRPAPATSDATRSSWRLARRAIERDLPTLGICRGFQLINVACGGTLDQHLADRIDVIPHRLDDSTYGMHDVVTEPGSRLREIAGERLRVHSHHHQGADRVGAGLVVGRAGRSTMT